MEFEKAAQSEDGTNINDCPTVMVSLRAILSMLQVSKRFHNMIVQGRQDLFFRIIWQLGWMLPACPTDWKSWDSVNDPLPLLTGTLINPTFRKCDTAPSSSTTVTRPNAKDRDWRAYMLTFLSQSTPHIRNRYRFHRMHMQYARGKQYKSEDGSVVKWWSCGKLGVGTDLVCPEPYEWEKAEWVKRTRIGCNIFYHGHRLQPESN